MERNGGVAHDPQVQELDAEVARLAARVAQLRAELGQAEAELRDYQQRDMAARRAAITGEATAPDTEERSTTMANAQPQLGPSAQKVLAYLEQHRGTPFAAGDVCEVVDCSTTEAGTALESLVRAGLVDREERVTGTVTYVAR